MLQVERNECFDDSSVTTAEIPSTWNVKKQMVETPIQTEKLEYKESASQSLNIQEKAMQTNPESKSGTGTFDPHLLTTFLTSVEKTISHQLMLNVKSTVFDGYSANWTDEVNSICVAQSLSFKRLEMDMLSTMVDFNKNGSVVASSYGRYDHESWCSHKGTLCLWNISAKNSNSDTPSFTTEVSSCLMCISFHPELPSLIAGGTFSGDVVVWDTNNNENPIVANSKINKTSHHESVSKVIWVKNSTTKGAVWDVLSIGNDGMIFLWDLASKFKSPVSGSQLLVGQIPRNLSAGAAKVDSHLGATTAAFTKDNSTQLIVGTEAGYLLKCTTSNATPLSSKAKSLGNPVLFSYAPPHSGPVQDVSFSPFHRNLFLSCGSDGQLRLYNLLQSTCIQTFVPSNKPLHCVAWSPTKATVFACSSSDGNFYIYDLSSNDKSPQISMQANEFKNIPLTALSFNTKKPNEYMATGDASGNVKIWRLSSNLVVGGYGDEKILNELI